MACLALPCLALPCLALPCLALPWLGLAWLGSARLGLASPCLAFLFPFPFPCPCPSLLSGVLPLLASLWGSATPRLYLGLCCSSHFFCALLLFVSFGSVPFGSLAIVPAQPSRGNPSFRRPPSPLEASLKAPARLPEGLRRNDPCQAPGGARQRAKPFAEA